MRTLKEIIASNSLKTILALQLKDGNFCHKTFIEASPNSSIQDERDLVETLVILGSKNGPTFLTGFLTGCQYTRELMDKEAKELERLSKED